MASKRQVPLAMLNAPDINSPPLARHSWSHRLAFHHFILSNGPSRSFHLSSPIDCSLPLSDCHWHRFQRDMKSGNKFLLPRSKTHTTDGKQLLIPRILTCSQVKKRKVKLICLSMKYPIQPAIFSY